MFEPFHNILSNVRADIRKYVVSWLKHSIGRYSNQFSFLETFFSFMIIRRLVAGKWLELSRQEFELIGSVWRKARPSETKCPWLNLRTSQLVFPSGTKIYRHSYLAERGRRRHELLAMKSAQAVVGSIVCGVGQFAGNAHWAQPSPQFAHRARPNHSSVKTSTRCFHWGRKLQSRQ